MKERRECFDWKYCKNESETKLEKQHNSLWIKWWNAQKKKQKKMNQKMKSSDLILLSFKTIISLSLLFASWSQYGYLFITLESNYLAVFVVMRNLATNSLSIFFWSIWETLQAEKKFWMHLFTSFRLGIIWFSAISSLGNNLFAKSSILLFLHCSIEIFLLQGGNCIINSWSLKVSISSI